MHHVEQMLKSHPHPNGAGAGGVAECIVACLDCASACATCADACIAEDEHHELMRCIRLNQDCAAICRTTADVLSRANEPDIRVVKAILIACETACEACAVECEKHTNLKHCQVCAQACRECLAACHAILATAGSHVSERPAVTG